MQLPAAATYLAKIRGHRRHHLGVAQKHPAIFVLLPPSPGVRDSAQRNDVARKVAENGRFSSIGVWLHPFINRILKREN